ncbi:BACON domain-containing protein [Prevotella fusca]
MCKLKNIYLAALVLVLLTTISNCTNREDESRWTPMKWTSDYTGDPRNIMVPTEGGNYKLVCNSYQTLRFTSMTTDNSSVQYGKEIISSGIQGGWYSAELTGNKLTITVTPNTTGKVRKLSIGVRADDAFDRVRITQEK